MHSALRFVLVAPQHPGNIGAAARAIKTMGFDRLVLVAPQCEPLAPEAIARASGAADLLTNAWVVSSIDEALAEVTLSAAFTSRSRSYVTPFLTPEAFAKRALEELRSSPQAAIAVVFGNEAHGLPNEVLWRCTHPVAIPANPDYPSLNLAAAIQIAAYVLARTLADSAALPRAILPEPDQRPCTQAEIEGVVGHFLTVAERIGFYDPSTPKRLEARLRRLFARARLEQAEANLLRGFFKACALAAQASQSPLPPDPAIIEKNGQELR